MHIKNPITIQTMTLKSRLVMAPVASEKATKEGHVTEKQIAYYDKMSSNKWLDLFIIEHSYVSKEGKASPYQLSVADDSCIEGLKKIADVVHKNGSKAVLQISHAGSASNSDISGCQPIGPSTVANPRKGGIPEEMTIDAIKEMIQKFIDAGYRAKLAGFDGVEIHSAHGYFLNQFFSPLMNHRQDFYGGSLENRVRIHLEIIKGLREKLGADYPLFLRLGASDYDENGVSLDESISVSKMFESAGIDVLDISGGFCGYTGNGLEGQGYFKELSRPLKDELNIPVILTGGVTEIQAAEDLLVDGQADLIGVARALMKDHEWGYDFEEN